MTTTLQELSAIGIISKGVGVFLVWLVITGVIGFSSQLQFLGLIGVGIWLILK